MESIRSERGGKGEGRGRGMSEEEGGDASEGELMDRGVMGHSRRERRF